MSYRAVPRGDYLGALTSAAAGAAAGSFFPGIGNLVGGLVGGLFGLFSHHPSPEEMAAARVWIHKNVFDPFASITSQIGRQAAVNRKLKPYGLYWYGPNDPRGLVRLPKTKRSR